MPLKPGQQKCIDTLDRSLVVAAGAGSGKTFTLTKRIVHAIESGAVDGIERVCAITFTNKAAGELKSRIKAELRSRGLAEQALKVDEAWISTIHGACARILRAHALELDIDPKFTMIDPALAIQLQNRAIDEVLYLARIGGSDDDEAPKGWPSLRAVDALLSEYPARSYGMNGTSVESMLFSLMGEASSHIDGYDAFVYSSEEANAAQLAAAVFDAYEALADAARGQKKNESREAFVATVERIVPEMRMGIEKPSFDARMALALLDELPIPKRVGAADYKDQVAETLDLLRRCVMELRLSMAAPHLHTLVALAQKATDIFEASKREEGVLDNNDLLIKASKAIADYPDIAALYADKFQLVMVDEFQDTDQMQVDMIKRFSGPGACRLCTVGDAQQSIYRFRGADVAVYRRHLYSVKASNSDSVIMLPDNFRSHPDVLSLVDRVFERPSMFGGEFMPLAPGRDEARVKRPFTPEVPRIQVQLTSNDYKGASTAFVREVAAARIADAFADLHARGHSAGEMAILLGVMSHADVYASALRERGLACVITGGSVFSSIPEVAVVLEMARVVANPRQTKSLFNVLLSPLFELDARDFLVLATDTDEQSGQLVRKNLYKGLKSCVRALREKDPVQDWSPKLTLAVRVMGDLLDGSGRSLVSRVIMRVIVESGWLSRLERQGAEGMASAANVYKAVRMVEAIERSQAAGPACTVALFETLLEESKEAPGALSATGGDFVRIMTIHASKGLEFPIVAVGEFRDAGGSSSKLLTCSDEGKVYLSLDLGNTVSTLEGAAKLGDLPQLYAAMTEGSADEDELLEAVRHADGALALRAALYERERVGDEEEAKRLLYVALTRAKEALVVSLMGKRTKDNPQATPKNCLGAVVSALAGCDAGFDVGVSHFEFGGSQAALVEHVALDAEDEQRGMTGEGEDKQDDAADAAGITGSAGAMDAIGAADVVVDSFFVPAVDERPHVSRAPYAPAHEGVFSYSSIAEVSHEDDALDGLVRRFFVEVDGVRDEDEMSASEFGSGSSDTFGEQGDLDAFELDGFATSVWRSNRNAAVVDEDDGSWAYTGATTADSDKATDLGTAFHRLAQYAAITHTAHGPLEIPPDERIESLAHAGCLDDVQRQRLAWALSRWFGSDVAREMAQFEDLRAEVPFYVSVLSSNDDDGDGYEVHLEGEIDLLALDDSRVDGSRAIVVDYKTGGHDDETADALARKHVLQAACYAYAIMLQGIAEVDAVFVRVERPRVDDASQPQCVRYRFSSGDVPVLKAAISEIYARSRGM